MSMCSIEVAELRESLLCKGVYIVARCDGIAEQLVVCFHYVLAAGRRNREITA